MKKSIFIALSITIASIISTQWSCKKPTDTTVQDPYSPTPYILQAPTGFPAPFIPNDNKLTKEGINLGKHLFYDVTLSKNKTQSCSSCHNQAMAFTDNNKAVSTGVDNIAGHRNAQPLINLAFRPNSFFWDGRAITLEQQIEGPVPNPIEMHLEWIEAIQRLQTHTTVDYKTLFYKAFGTKEITKELTIKALAQFLRTMVSSNSTYDKFVRNQAVLTPSELNGFQIYTTERGDCFHCHSLAADGQGTDNQFHNNGLDATFIDKGRGDVTHQTYDDGKFLTPTLRNIALTAPYMHDGRFTSLEEVVNHYNSGGVASPTVDVLMKHQGVGLELTPQDRTDLINFLKTLTDDDFINNPAYKTPF